MQHFENNRRNHRIDMIARDLHGFQRRDNNIFDESVIYSIRSKINELRDEKINDENNSKIIIELLNFISSVTNYDEIYDYIKILLNNSNLNLSQHIKQRCYVLFFQKLLLIILPQIIKDVIYDIEENYLSAENSLKKFSMFVDKSGIYNYHHDFDVKTTKIKHLILSSKSNLEKINDFTKYFDNFINSKELIIDLKKILYNSLNSMLNNSNNDYILRNIITKHFDKFKNDINDSLKDLQYNHMMDELIQKLNNLKYKKGSVNLEIIDVINTVIEMILNEPTYSDIQIVYNRLVHHLDVEYESKFDGYLKNLLENIGKPMLIKEFLNSELFGNLQIENQLYNHFLNKDFKSLESELQQILDELPETENVLSVKIEECLKYFKLNETEQVILDHLYHFRNNIDSEAEKYLNVAISSILNQSSAIEIKESLMKLKPFVVEPLSELFDKYMKSDNFRKNFVNEKIKYLPETIQTIIEQLKQANYGIEFFVNNIISNPSTITIDESLKSLKEETLTDKLHQLIDDYLNSKEHSISLYCNKTQALSDKALKKLSFGLIDMFEQKFGIDVYYGIKHCIELILSDQKDSEELNNSLHEIRDKVFNSTVIDEYFESKNNTN